MAHQSRPLAGGSFLLEDQGHATHRTHRPSTILGNDFTKTVYKKSSSVISYDGWNCTDSYHLQWNLQIKLLVSLRVRGIKIDRCFRHSDIVSINLKSTTTCTWIINKRVCRGINAVRTTESCQVWPSCLSSEHRAYVRISHPRIYPFHSAPIGKLEIYGSWDQFCQQLSSDSIAPSESPDSGHRTRFGSRSAFSEQARRSPSHTSNPLIVKTNHCEKYHSNCCAEYLYLHLRTFTHGSSKVLRL